jgi:hypothetical protein
MVADVGELYGALPPRLERIIQRDVRALAPVIDHAR